MVYMAEKFFVESQETVHICFEFSHAVIPPFRICKFIIWQGGPEFLPNHKKMQTNLAVRPCLAGSGDPWGRRRKPAPSRPCFGMGGIRKRKGDAAVHLKVKETKKEIYAVRRTPKHVPPHLHHALEIVYVIEGALELGVGQELYHMEQGDAGLVFPDIIHHYQVFSEGENQAGYILVPPSFTDIFTENLQTSAPVCPVVGKAHLEPDAAYAIRAVLQMEEKDPMVVQAYVQIILARCMGKLKLAEKSSVGSDDLIYRAVSYVSGNFREQFSLGDMARDLGVSKYVLSRVFSKTFHCNFNQYLNEARLGYASGRLEHTSDTVLDICLDSGFESQRTFNRVFKERYKVTPSEYRKKQKGSMGL